MSDIDAGTPLDGVPEPTAEEVVPFTSEGQDAEAVTPDEPEVLDLEEFGSKYVTVKRDGEDQRVLLKDAVAEGMRHADYTRKTQEAARLRQEAEWGLTLQRAYEQNPALAIQILQAQTAQEQAPGMVQPPEDPNERRIWEMERDYEQRIAPLEAYHAEQELRNIVGSLEAKYADVTDFPFKGVEVARRAVEMGYDHPRYLDDVYKQMFAEEMMGRQLAQREVASASVADNQARQAAAAGIVSHGSGTAAPMTPPVSSPTSLRESFVAAYIKAGGDVNDL